MDCASCQYEWWVARYYKPIKVRIGKLVTEKVVPHLVAMHFEERIKGIGFIHVKLRTVGIIEGIIEFIVVSFN